MKATILDMENRVNTLRGRTGKENDNIVKKLERRLRALKSQEIWYFLNFMI